MIYALEPLKEIEMFKRLKAWFRPVEVVCRKWSLEHVISSEDYTKLEDYISSLGMEEYEYHVFEKIKCGFTSHGFYQSIHVKCGQDKMDLIEKYIEEIPRRDRAEIERSRGQSDRLLRSGVTCTYLGRTPKRKP